MLCGDVASSVSTRHLNLFFLGLSFLLMFTAFQSIANIQAVLIHSAKGNETEEDTNDEPCARKYQSLAIIYYVGAFSMWLGPSAMSLFGPRLAMLAGSALYAVYVGSFFDIMDWLLYASSVLLGIGAGLLWTSQGAFLTTNSTEKTLARNTGIFWAMFQSSFLIGNTFVFLVFQGQEEIDDDTRILTVSVLFGCSVVGMLSFLLLRPTPWATEDKGVKSENPWEAFKTSIGLLSDWDLLCLVPTFTYVGLAVTFFSGVYGPSLGFTQHFEDPKSLPGLHGILLGAAEVSCSVLFSMFGHVTNRIGRFPLVAAGIAAHFACYVIVFLNIPNDAPFGDTEGESLIHPPSMTLALLSSFLLGVGDSCMQTQTTSLLGRLHMANPGPAFAVYRFIQFLTAGAGFQYSGCLLLRAQLGILAGAGLVALVLFVYVDVKAMKKKKKKKKGKEGEKSADTDSRNFESKY